MTLVHVMGMNVEAERPQDADPADAENDLLFQPISVVAAIEIMGQGAVVGAVLLEIGVEKQDRDAVSVRRGMGVEPRAEPNGPSFDFDGDHGVERGAPALDLPPVRMLDLAPVTVDFPGGSSRLD